MSIVPQYNLARRRGAVGLARSLYARYGSGRNRMYGFYSGMGAARRAAQGASRTMTMMRRRKTYSGQGVTTQHDSKLIYRKKRMPAYKRRSLRRFSNKVNWAQEKDLGTQQYLINQLSNFSNSTAGNQLTADVSLYSFVSTTSRHNDMSQLAGFISAAITTPGTGLTVDPSAKIIFQSAILDVTIRNSTTFGNTGTNSAGRLEVDVYELTFGTELQEGAVTYSQLISNTGLFAQNPTRTSSIGGGGTEISRELRGVTPFDLSYVLSRFKCKIWKKTKYQLSQGEQVTYQMRDPKRRVCTLRELTTVNGLNKPGWTKMLYITAKLAPGLPIGIGATDFQEVLDIGISRKYVYKVENYTEDRTQYTSL